MTDLVLPIVHPNGTSKEGLLELREAAYSALDAAADALKKMAPNGRDYYPHPGRMERAVAKHDRRLRAVRDLMDELERECMEIDRTAR